ncbi:Ferredoxin [Chitinispirillum alkaliphilum]|nr:Ferredoxin [Chitinispirillum alkaliphilum]
MLVQNYKGKKGENMKQKIFYFSGTGNTHKLVKDLTDKISGLEAVRISYDMDFDQRECDVAGIAYPVYCFVLPNIVTNFVKNVRFSSSAYIFGLASYGGLLTSSGRQLKKMIKKRGYTLNAGFAVNMPGNATIVYDVVKPEKRELMYKKESERIEQIAEIIKKRGSYGIDTNLGILGRVASLIGPSMMRSVQTSDKCFFVDNNCDSCGICTKVCPVNNIDISSGKPQWQHKCESCMACFHWCPKRSIQGSKKTSSRGRYHHPDITIADMLNTHPQPQTK